MGFTRLHREQCLLAARLPGALELVRSSRIWEWSFQVYLGSRRRSDLRRERPNRLVRKGATAGRPTMALRSPGLLVGQELLERSERDEDAPPDTDSGQLVTADRVVDRVFGDAQGGGSLRHAQRQALRNHWSPPSRDGTSKCKDFLVTIQVSLVLLTGAARRMFSGWGILVAQIRDRRKDEACRPWRSARCSVRRCGALAKHAVFPSGAWLTRWG